MKITKQNRREAKDLFRVYLVNGIMDEARVNQAVDAVLAGQPRGYQGTLSHFTRLIKLYQAEHSAHIESAAALAPEQQEQFKASLVRKHGAGLTFSFQQNPALLGGVRIQVGSNVYDGSVRGRLDALQDSFKA